MRGSQNARFPVFTRNTRINKLQQKHIGSM